MTGVVIAGLSAVLIVFVSIVLFLFINHSKRVKRELKETRNEIQDTNRKIYSEEVYDDIGEYNYYESAFDDQQDYEYAGYSYSEVRYETKLNCKPDQESDYLRLTNNQPTPDSATDPSYIIMTKARTYYVGSNELA